MKKSFVILIFLIFLLNNLFAQRLEVLLNISLNMGGAPFLLRKIERENFYDCKDGSLNYSFAFISESFDNILWGNTNKFSGYCKFNFNIIDELQLKVGPGISFVASFGNLGISPDIYIGLNYKIFYLKSETSFFSDGLFNKNGIGIKWLIWNFILNSGMENILISDYKNFYLIPGFTVGVGYVF